MTFTDGRKKALKGLGAFVGVVAVLALIVWGVNKWNAPATTQQVATTEYKAPAVAVSGAVANPPPAPTPQVVRYGIGAEVFRVEGTPQGFTFDGVSNASKAQSCKNKGGTLVRSDTCRVLSNRQRECKNQCRLPDGSLIGNLSWN